jgi:HEAT repeat protein
MELLNSAIEPREAVRAKAATALNFCIAADQPKDPDSGPIKALATALRNDTAPEVRASSAATLGHCRAYEVMDSLIDALEDKDVSVRRAAHAALDKITGLALEFRPDGPEAERSEAVKNLRAAWRDNPQFREGLVRYYRGDRFKTVYRKYAR